METIREALERKRDEASDPRHRALLETMLRHYLAELRGDVAETMATVAPEPRYRFWGPSGLTRWTGTDEVRAGYETMLSGGGLGGTSRVERVLVDDDRIFHDGVSEFTADGAGLSHLQIDAPGDGGPDARYRVRMRLAVVINFRDGLVAGEDVYFTGSPEVTRV